MTIKQIFDSDLFQDSQRRIQNKYHTWESLSLINVEDGFKNVYPEFKNYVDFYCKGPVNILSQSLNFFSCMHIQSVMDNYKNPEKHFDYFELGDFMPKIYNFHDNLASFYDGLFFLVNKWSDIDTTHPHLIFSDEKIMRDIHRRLISSEKLRVLFDRTWEMYELSVKSIPENQLDIKRINLESLNNHLIHKNFSYEGVIPKLHFNSLNSDLLEYLELFKESYHDKLLEHKLNKYF
jgi:hypothetical protein